MLKQFMPLSVEFLRHVVICHGSVHLSQAQITLRFTQHISHGRKFLLCFKEGCHCCIRFLFHAENITQELGTLSNAASVPFQRELVPSVSQVDFSCFIISIHIEEASKTAGASCRSAKFFKALENLQRVLDTITGVCIL